MSIDDAYGFQAASAVHDVVRIQQDTPDRNQDIDAILGRLDRIESALGFSRGSSSVTADVLDPDQDEGSGEMSLRPLWKAVRHLKLITRPAQDDALWSHPVIKHLWYSYAIISIMSCSSNLGGLIPK